jgi:hypothetical protein
MAAVHEKLLEERLTSLRLARSWSPRLVSSSKATFVQRAPRSFCALNALRFAADKCLAAAETIDLFPHAAALGVFEMNWVILCPLCSCVIDSFRALRNLDKHCRCVICHIGLVAALDDMMAITFTISPDLVPRPRPALGCGLGWRLSPC